MQSDQNQLSFEFKKDFVPISASYKEYLFIYSNNRLERFDLAKLREKFETEDSFYDNQNYPLLIKHPPLSSALGQLPSKGNDLAHLMLPLSIILKNYYSNPLASITSSKTMLLPHQVHAATRIVEAVSPRFLIADEVGLGKTIEAGLVIKELILKYGYEKILICVPSPLVFQWQNELRQKFNEDFTVIQGKDLRKQPAEMEKQNKFIVSLDLAKDERYRSLFIKKNFDIVIFDEAHRLRRDDQKVTKAYSFAEALSQQAKVFILLSATPFRGKIEEIYYLIRLLDSDILGPFHSFIQKYENGSLNLQERLKPVIIRRRKVDVGGFTKRFAKTVRFNLSPAERIFYDATTEYVKREFNRAIAEGEKLKTFVMIVFQKLLDSSSFALLSALEKRKNRLEDLYFFRNRTPQTASPPAVKQSTTTISLTQLLEENKEDQLNNLIEENPEESENILLNQITFNPREAAQEINTLNGLITLGRRIEKDVKLEILIKTIRQMQKSGHKKFIIFTQFRNTLEYVYNNIKESFLTCVFHGGLSAKEKEAAIENLFGEYEVIICTEAGGEGRNMQVASALFNYDLPWSPLRIEQRIGRIHRFGQKKDVHIVNFASRDTIAEKILEILDKKIKLFEDTLGECDTLLGILEDEINFENTFSQFLKSKKTRREFDQEISRSLSMAKENLSKINNLISPEFLDFNMNAFKNVVSHKEKNQHNELALLKLIEDYLKKTNEGLLSKQSGSENGEVTIQLEDRKIRGSFFYHQVEQLGFLDYIALGHDWIDATIKNILESGNKHIFYKRSNSVSKEETEFVMILQIKIHLDRVYKRIYPLHYKQNHIPELLNHGFSLDGNLEQITISATDMQKYMNKIMPWLNQQIQDEVNQIEARVIPQIKRKQQSAHEAYCENENELNDKLSMQRGKSKWYGSAPMQSAIKRTLNQKQAISRQYTQKVQFFKLWARRKVEVELLQFCRL